MSLALCEQLPYWEFLEHPFSHLVLNDGSVASGIELLPLDIECYSADRLNFLTENLRAFVNSLPEEIIVQFLVKFENEFDNVIQRHEHLVTTTNDFLLNLDIDRISNLNDQIESQELFAPRLLMFIRIPNQIKKTGFWGIKKFSNELEKGYEDRIQTLNQSIENARSLLARVGFHSENLEKKDFVEIIYKSLNPKRAQEIKSPKLKESNELNDLEIESPRSQLVFSDLILDQEDFVLDQMRTRVLSLKTLPENTFAGMVKNFSTLPFKYELLFNFNIPEQSKIIKSLEQKRRTTHSLVANTGGRVSDLEGETRLNQTTGLIRELIETGQKVFEAELLIILREENSLDGKKILNLNTKEVLSKFKSLSGAEGIQETVSSWKLFSSSLPGASMNLIRKKKMKTNNMVDFLPLYGPSKGDELPYTLTHTRQGSLFSINPYDP
ncbi:MAG: TraC family protein, partial [Bdellovibrionales bacterium]|nr:TraC family protein [Bdellovibrionales bacterium]